ncbi:MAG TPA: hypothetical protein VKA30_03415, partial [Actinomycetota bacterium]|nr:hypothetical protein [Actinomycetota bacterium]
PAVTYLPGARTFAAGDTAGTIRLLDAADGSGRTIRLGAASTGGVYAIAPANLVGDRRPELAVGAGSTFYGFDLSGRKLWARPTGLYATSAIALPRGGHDDVLGLSWDGKAYALIGATGAVRWTVPDGQPAGAAVIRSSAGAADRILIATAWDDGFAGVRVASSGGKVVGSCRLRKTPFAVRPIASTTGGLDAVASTEQGDVYRFAT